MMDTDHSLEDSEGTESTQMLLALVQNGTSLSETMQIFNDIAEIIDLELHEFEQGITDKDKRIKVADKYTTRSLKRKREGFSTAKQKIDDYHDAIARGENPEFPIFINDVNTAATSAIRAHVSSNIIKRKYGGIGAVNTPGYNTVMYHVMNGQPMLFEELREHTLYKECLKNEIDPFSTISDNNPFIVQVTESSPIDFEDTIVIRHKPVTYLVNSVVDIDGNISLSYIGNDGISYEIDPNDPLYNQEFGTYTSANLYIDENGNYTTDE